MSETRFPWCGKIVQFGTCVNSGWFSCLVRENIKDKRESILQCTDDADIPRVDDLFLPIFSAFQRRKNLVFCFVSGDCSQILHLVFWCCRYFLSREEKTSTQAGARLCNNLWLWCKRAFVHQKGSLFGSWCTPCVGAESTDPWCGASAAGVNSNYLSGALRSLGSGAYTNPTTTHQASCFTREASRNLWNCWCFELFEVLRIIWVTFGNKLHAVDSNLCRNPPSWGLGGEAEVIVNQSKWCSKMISPIGAM